MKKERNASLDAFGKLGMIASQAQYGRRLACRTSRREHDWPSRMIESQPLNRDRDFVRFEPVAIASHETRFYLASALILRSGSSDECRKFSQRPTTARISVTALPPQAG
jgi:hypothetical protein